MCFNQFIVPAVENQQNGLQKGKRKYDRNRLKRKIMKAQRRKTKLFRFFSGFQNIAVQMDTE